MRSSLPAIFYAFRTYLFPSLRQKRRALGDVARQAIDGMARRRPTRLCSPPFPPCIPSMQQTPPPYSLCALLPALSRWRTAPPLAVPSPPSPLLSPLRGARQGPIGSRTGDADGGDDDSKQWRARRDLRNRSGGSEQAGRLAVARSAAGARGQRHRHHRDSGDAAAEDGDQGRIDRPPAKEERDPSHISLPVDSGIANLYL